MGNSVFSAQGVGCAHTGDMRMWASLLPDKLSKPTAEMVDALLFLQGQSLRIKEFGVHGLGAVSASDPDDEAARPLMLLAAGYCGIFGYNCAGLVSDPSIDGKPQAPNDFLNAFQHVLQQPEKFLNDLLSLRAQVVPMHKAVSMKPLTQASEECAKACSGSEGEILQNLALYLRATIECAEIYEEIRESVAMGQLDEKFASLWLDGDDSDQQRMIGAMDSSGCGKAVEEEEVMGTSQFERSRACPDSPRKGKA
mmetsp:Transcript_26106/g.68659  ORF Transcript_26106/g.68659 Transcript_26106/m.68659 type:complete len:253 (-) Transcript_26106:156-914(-)